MLPAVEQLLVASSVRLDVLGVPALDGLDMEVRGERVVVLGGPRALFEAAAGLRGVTRGTLLVEGMPPIEAVRARRLAGVPQDPPLPPRWLVAEYVGWSARLAGYDRRAARALASEAIEAMELGALAKTRLGVATKAAKRATLVAAALATGARTVLLDDPLAGLGDEAIGAFARVLARALEKRRWALFAARLPLESPLATSADEAIVLDGARVVAQGAPGAIAAERTTLALKVLGGAEEVAAFARAIESSGGKVSALAQARGPFHLRVELGPLAARDLFRLALATQATLLELRPFALPLS
jgi:molybdate transport system ATP-binding protein